jgi:peptidyl-prolyl cis-trans isomerase SurA
MKSMPHRLRSTALAIALAAAAASVSAQNLRAASGLPALPRTPSGSQNADFIVAVVDSLPITNQEVRNRVLRAEQQLTRDGGALPPREQLTREVLDRLIEERAQLSWAKESGIRIEDFQLDQTVANLARQNGMETADFRRRVEREGTPWDSFVDDIRNELLLQRLREREVEGRVRVTEGDVDEYIRAQSAITDPNKIIVTMAQILVAVPEGSNDAQIAALKQKADRALARVKAGEEFGTVAQQMSDGAEARAGGVIGERPVDRFPQLFVDATQRLRRGDTSAVVRSGAGFHILKLVDRRTEGMPSVVVTQTKVRHILIRTTPQVSQTGATERISAIRRRIAGGAKFEDVAKELSQDGSAEAGGDLGWVSPGSFVPEFEEVMNTLPPGQLSDPVVSRFGVHLIRVDERRDAALGDKEQRELVRNAVRGKKAEETYGSWARDLRNRAYVELRDTPL